MKLLIRLFAFFTKEFNEVRRQPRLVLSLIMGPFLILLLFGAGYQGERPHVRTALVVPPDRLDDPQLEQLKQSIELNFDLVQVDSDLDAAMGQLHAGEIDVVEVLPADIEQRVLRGEQAPVSFHYNEVNPLNEQWIQYLAYAQVSELNKTVLMNMTSQFQGEASSTRELLGQVRSQLETLSSSLDSARQQETQRSIRQLKEALALLVANPLLASQISGEQGQASNTRAQLQALYTDLDALDQAISNGTLDREQQRISSARDRISGVEQASERFSSLPPAVIVSPLQQQYENIYGQTPDYMTFYAPSVLALIIQHIAVTLGALSLVRERLLGAIEFYGVAPVGLTQVLLGKYLGYTLSVGIIALVLVGLMMALQVPFAGSVLLFIGLLALFTVASLGIGFLLSALSTSDSQAVQLSMLVLLMSIFFSGFFLPLENFSEPVRSIGYILPLTHGITAFQAIMLRGSGPSELAWLVLSAVALVTFVVVLLIWQRQFRQLA